MSDRSFFAPLVLAAILGVAGSSGCRPSLSASASTTTQPHPRAGWLTVEARSLALSFSVPARRAAAIKTLDDYNAFARCAGMKPVGAYGWTPRYARFVCVRAARAVYAAGVMVMSDRDLFIWRSVFARGARKAAHRARIAVSGYPGLEARRTLGDGRVEAWRVWTAGDRFYLATTIAPSVAAYSSARARRFFDSLTLLDRP